MDKHIRVPEAEYEVLIRIAFLISDAVMAERNEGFRTEMNVDPAASRAEADALVDKWESMG